MAEQGPKRMQKQFDEAAYWAFIAGVRSQLEFTTGVVAKICLCAPRTVSKWFDSGRLRGYRIPGSQDRRIPREHLLRFLKENGMQPAYDRLSDHGESHTVAYVGMDGEACMAALGSGYTVHIARNQMELCVAIGKHHPGSVLIDFVRPGNDPPALLCSGLRGLTDMGRIALIGIRDQGAPFDPSCVDASVSDVPNFLAAEIVAQVKKKNS